MGKYREEARKEARAIARRQPLFGEIVAELISKQGTTDKVHLNEYPSGEGDSLADRSYSLTEAVKVIEDLEEYEEEDEAYWQGKGVREALRIAAALTYRNAVHRYFTSVIDAINDAVGNMEIAWTLEERHRMETAMARPGVLDWHPDDIDFAKLPRREREALETEHQARLSQEIQSIVSESIKGI